ncbi:hypothetical protein PU629_06980 [Pullulanibacillus sp. KACC 23026]|uniref:hypothetical protein n=1 Tax=Pullulanibacillus sp. KACC 23026 TaxID=3028315 RepID=UPI0023B10F69|nr:hypothetical protein [Pullulanibacillus sp. KACC 23026]WEG14104.1 hypothetical protein PU629_06980 [Pullulanibacillus sp. KACC 23026]
MSVNISIGAINVNAVFRNGAVTSGESNMGGWSTHSKQNFANGQYIGLSYTSSINNVLDSDLIDSPISDNDGIPSNQNQSL